MGQIPRSTERILVLIKRLILATDHLLLVNSLLGVWPPIFSVRRPFFYETAIVLCYSAHLNHLTIKTI